MSKKFSMVRGCIVMLGAFLAVSLVGCADDGTGEDDPPEELSESTSEMKKNPRSQVLGYAEKNDCSIEPGSTYLMLDCPISSDRAVMSYAREKLGSKKAYRCSRGRICISL